MNGSPSSIIMFGLGNGTFSGSPSLLVTRGLGVGIDNSVAGPFFVKASQSHTPGSVASQHHTPGSVSSQHA